MANETAIACSTYALFALAILSPAVAINYD
jgi:hypothetical protein